MGFRPVKKIDNRSLTDKVFFSEYQLFKGTSVVLCTFE